MNQTLNLSIRDIKKLATQMYSGHFFQCFAVVLGCQIVALAPQYLAYLFVNNDIIYEVISFASWLLGVVLTVGSCKYCMNVTRGEKACLDDVVDAFQQSGQSVLVQVLGEIRTALRCLLFIVPGIIYYLKIAFAKFILIDNPNLDAKTVLDKSVYCLSGNLAKFVTLQLSYIGIYIACGLPRLAYNIMCGPDYTTYHIDPSTMSSEALMTAIDEFISDVITFSNTPIMIALGFIVTLATTYAILNNICFYDIIIGNIVIEEHDDATDIKY